MINLLLLLALAVLILLYVRYDRQEREAKRELQEQGRIANELARKMWLNTILKKYNT